MVSRLTMLRLLQQRTELFSQVRLTSTLDERIFKVLTPVLCNVITTICCATRDYGGGLRPLLRTNQNHRRRMIDAGVVRAECKTSTASKVLETAHTGRAVFGRHWPPS
jgi:hypothetical protein